MRIFPLEPREPRPAAFIVRVTRDSLTIQSFGEPPETYRGVERIVEGIFSHADYAIYSLIPLYQLPECGDPRLWKLYRFGKQWTRAEVGNVSIYGLVGYGLDPMQLAPLFDAVGQLNVRYGSQSAMARDIWRATLAHPLTLMEEPGEWGFVGRKGLQAGRRDAIPGSYQGAELADIPAAFPTAMAQSPLPTRLRPAPPWWYEHGLAEAVVSGGRGEWSMLDRGETSRRVVWSFEELRAAVAGGCDVALFQVWEGLEPRDLFSAWFDVVSALRQLPGHAGQLGKGLANRLWGSFAYNPNVKYSRTTFGADGTPFIEYLKHGSSPETAFLSAIIGGRVRARLFEEGLQRGAIFCETDSVILPLGNEPAGWRRKIEMSRVEIPSARALRFKCLRGVREGWATDGCVDCAGDRWHYLVQGNPADSLGAELAYRKEAKNVGCGM